MWFEFALIATLCWSGSDLFSKIGSRPDDKYSHWKMVIAVGLIMGLHAGYEMLFGGVLMTGEVLLRYLPVSLLYIGSMVLGYVALRYIELSLSSPVCNSSGAIASILCFLFLGQRLSGWQTAAVAVVCAGVVALGILQMTESDEARAIRQDKSKVKYTKSLIALLLPVLYCLLDAAGTFADALVLESLDEDAANTAYELTFLAMGCAAFVYTYLIRREKFRIPREWPKLLGGCFETAGQLAYVYALADNAVAAAPVISSYCAFSVLWSRIFLKEKLNWKHYAVIGITVAGIVALGLLDEL